jgi:hypothetical protein
LLVKSTNEEMTIPYHKKVISNFNSIIKNISPRLLEANPILSGSAAISLLYAPSKPYGDLDFYFRSKEDFNLAFSILRENANSTYETENAVTIVTTTNIIVQLIRKFYLPPQELILEHDFLNVAIAITPTEIYTTKKTMFAWYENVLDLNKIQLKDSPTCHEKLSFILCFIPRIQKYLERYQLQISQKLKQSLYEFINFLTENESQIDNMQIKIADYYAEYKLIKSLKTQDVIRDIQHLFTMNAPNEPEYFRSNQDENLLF